MLEDICTAGGYVADVIYVANRVVSLARAGIAKGDRVAVHVLEEVRCVITGGYLPEAKRTVWSLCWASSESSWASIGFKSSF